EVVQPPQDTPYLSLASFVVFDRARHNQQLVEGVGRARRLIGKIAPHGGERDKNLVDVPPVITGVLFLGRHHSDYRERNVVEIDELSDGGTTGEQLFLRIRAEKSN